MSKVISKATIDKWNDDHKIEQLKHQKEIKVAVNPPKQKVMRSYGRRSAPQHRVDPVALMNRIQQINSVSNEYNEYKDSIKRTTASIIGSLGKNEEEQQSVREKIMTSGDIASICSKKLMDLNVIENEWAVLGLTIAGKFLEAKWENARKRD